MVPHPPILVVVPTVIIRKSTRARPVFGIALQHSVPVDAPGLAGIEILAAGVGIQPIHGLYDPGLEAILALDSGPGVVALSQGMQGK